MEQSKITQQVADTLSTSSDKVVQTVIDRMVNVELTSRADNLEKVIKQIDKVQFELRKLKPDIAQVSIDGGKTEMYSTKVYDEKLKLQEKLARLNKAVVDATESNKWKELAEIASKAE